MREIVHIQAGQCGNQIGSKVVFLIFYWHFWILSSGKSFRMNTEFNLMDHTRENLTCNWNESMFTTMRLMVFL